MKLKVAKDGVQQEEAYKKYKDHLGRSGSYANSIYVMHIILYSNILIIHTYTIYLMEKMEKKKVLKLTLQ